MKMLHFTLRSFAAICFAFVMSSATCDFFQNADVITFNANLEHEFVISEEAEHPGGFEYSTKPEDELLDAAAVSSTFAEHADRIESIKINSIKYTLSGYSDEDKCGSVAFSDGTFTFTDPDVGGTTEVVVNVEHANLETAQGTEFTLDIDQAGMDKISNLLKDKKKVKIDASGHLSCTPLYLTVKAKLDCTMTARVL